MHPEAEQKEYFKNGLHFSCTRCSMCCRHDPGYVFLSEKDLTHLTDHFSMDRETFIATYCRTINVGGFSRISLSEQSNYDCVFWRNGACQVYESRPLQCRSYPFWDAHLDSQESWDEAATSCPGIGIGKLHTREEIIHWLHARRQEPPVSR